MIHTFTAELDECTVQFYAALSKSGEVLHVYFPNITVYASLRVRDLLSTDYGEIDAYNALWRYIPHSLTVVNNRWLREFDSEHTTALLYARKQPRWWRVAYGGLTLFDI